MFPALIAECLGTALFFSCILSYGDPIPIAVGLLAAIYAFGKVSGGHFNSAVSFMMYLHLLTFKTPIFTSYEMRFLLIFKYKSSRTFTFSS